MDNLANELQEHFKAETAWRPGLGLWIGEVVTRLFRIENSAEKERARRAKMNQDIFELVVKMERMEQNASRRAFKGVCAREMPSSGRTVAKKA